jgi:DNA-binding response OmpR family regulator
MIKILLIEDDKNAQELYVEILTSSGYNVEVASDGEAGLAKIMTGGYSLIFLDIMLPKMDGLSVLAALKKNKKPDNPNGKIIILSNLTHDPVVKEAMDLGASDHISKSSLNPDQFIAKVKDLLI